PALLRNPTFRATWGEVQSWDCEVPTQTGGLGSRPGHPTSRKHENAHAQAAATRPRRPHVASPRFPRPDLTPCPENYRGAPRGVAVPAPTGHQSWSFQGQQEGTSPNGSEGTLLPLHWGHQEGPQGCGGTARILVTAARPATLPKGGEHKTQFPEGRPFPRSCVRSPDRSGRPAVQVFSLGQHRPSVSCGALKKGHQCPADKTSLEAAGSPSLRLPPFWKSPMVNRNPPHDRVRQLAEKTCTSDCPYL
ncbi:hypothetical protein E2I00_019755, partial [Balaenoptera physalus]